MIYQFFAISTKEVQLWKQLSGSGSQIPTGKVTRHSQLSTAKLTQPSKHGSMHMLVHSILLTQKLLVPESQDIISTLSTWPKVLYLYAEINHKGRALCCYSCVTPGSWTSSSVASPWSSAPCFTMTTNRAWATKKTSPKSGGISILLGWGGVKYRASQCIFFQYTGAISHEMISTDKELVREQEEFDLHFFGFTQWRRLQKKLLKPLWASARTSKFVFLKKEKDIFVNQSAS